MAHLFLDKNPNWTMGCHENGGDQIIFRQCHSKNLRKQVYALQTFTKEAGRTATLMSFHHSQNKSMSMDYIGESKRSKGNPISPPGTI